MSDQVSEFGFILLFIIGGALFAALTLFTSKLLRPVRPNYEKLTTYESGEDAIGSAWALFNPRFYIIALIFVLFEVEIIFLFPWAVVFGQKKFIDATDGLWGWFALLEMLLFIAVLSIGLAYVWRKGFLNWDKPEVQVKYVASKVPRKLYEAVNQKYERHVKSAAASRTE